MPALTQTVIARVYDCSREHPDCIESTEWTVDIDDAAAVQALARQVAGTFEGNEETEDWDILVCVETEDGTKLARATSRNDHAETQQDSMDETFVQVRDYTTAYVGVRAGQWYTWSRNGGKKGDCHGRMWQELYEEPKKASLEEAYAALIKVDGLDQDEAIAKLVEYADRMDERDIRINLGLATEIDAAS